MSAINLSSNKINVVKVADGQNGQSGFTQVLLYLYQRAASTPSKPDTSSYNPTNGTLTASDSWVSSINLTSGNNPCYVITTFLSIPAGTSGAININQNQWAAPAVIFQDGQDGKGISSITEYYLANDDRTTIPSYDDPDWNPVPMTATAGAPYVWNYELINYTSGQPTKSTPHVVGMYGAGGRGITSIVDYYAKSPTTSEPADNQFSPAVPPLDQTDKYLWNYELITYTDNNTEKSSKRIIGMYSKDGTSVTVSQTYYGTTNSSSVQPSSGEWTQGSPTNIPTGVWVWIKTVFSDGNEAITCSYAGTNGQNGRDGTSVTITSTSHSGQITTVYFSDGTSIQITDGANGKEISTITEYYAAYSRNDVAPTTGWNTDPSQAELSSSNPYLWNYELITYSNNTTTETSKRIIGTYSADGAPGADGKGISSITNYYKTTPNTTAPTTGWVTSPIPIPDQTNKYLWNYEHTVYTDNTESDTTAHIIGMYGEKGDTGASGSTCATIQLYQRGATVPDGPNGDVTYTFATGAVTGSLNGWTRNIPTGDTPCYMIIAQAIQPAGTTTDTIGSGEWSDPPVKIVENGASGFNSATVYLYKRGVPVSPATRLDGPNNTLTYNFISGQLTATDQSYFNGWQQTVPTSDGNPCWVTTAAAISQSDSVNITYNKWADSVILAENGADGQDGQDGVNGTNSITLSYYKRTTDNPPAVPTGTYNYNFTTNTFSGGDTISGWTKTFPTGTDPCWVTTISFVGKESTISGKSFTTPAIRLVSDGVDGQNGQDGADGYNYILLQYYIRSATEPTKPSGTYSYDFTNKSITPAISNWTQNIPGTNAAHDPCWVTTISFLGNDTTVSGQSFSDPVKMVTDGANGQNGQDGKDANQYTIHTMVEEIFKFVDIINSNYTNKKYEFSLDQLSFQAFDLKEQVFIPYSQSNNEKYCDLDIRIGTNDFREIIKEENYTDYIIKASQETQPAGSTVDMTLYKFNIVNLYNDYYNGTLLNKLNSDLTSEEKDNFVSEIRNFFEDIESTDFVIYGQVYEEDSSSFNIEKYVTLKNGLSDEMLKFSINAGGLNAAIQNTGLQFNAEGLVITNGGFTIKTQDGTNNPVTVFEIVENTVGAITNHSLYLNGTGRFTGDIYANNGYFNGEINSISGVIGGFTIGENSIISTDGNLKLFSSDGAGNSKIEVRNIDIGDGAEVSGSIRIGNLSLLNPSTYNGNVLTLIKKEQNDQSINYLTLTNNGNIIGNNWSIQKEGNNNYVTARFGYLIAQDGDFSGTIHAKSGEFSGEIISSVINASTINTANFVTEKTRAMGGAYIFKPVFEILNIAETNNSNQLEITLSDNSKQYIPELKQDTDVIIALSGNDIRYGKMISNTDNVLIVEFYSIDYSTILSQSEIYNTATILGYGNYQDVLIGINSDNAYTGDILPPRALVMEEFTDLQQLNSGTGDLDYHVRLFLGDLTNAPKERGIEGSGYGLYADNVFLKGSLTTSGNNVAGAHNYAGINTSRVIGFNYDAWSSAQDNSSDYTNDKIIFWGGAAGIDESQIQSSPFIVTDNGNIFARSGEFKGTVISDSLITNTIIKAPVIYGNNNKQGEPTLKIYDTNNEQGGIGFYKKVGNIDIESQETDDIKTLVLSNNGFSHYYNNESKQFLYFSESNADVFIDATRITTGTTNLYQNHFIDGNADIQIANDSINLQIGENSANSNITINPNTIINNGPTVINKNTMLITNDNKELKYTVSNGYYCLYVS